MDRPTTRPFITVTPFQSDIGFDVSHPVTANPPSDVLIACNAVASS